MSQPKVLIAGGGIAGMSMALTLHQIGVPCVVLETVSELKPLGVGINVQPNAVRELFDLGIGAEKLDQIGVKCREWALVGLKGNPVYSEPRGLEAGYNWPQYSVHRGKLQMLLYQEVLDRLGPDAVRLGVRVTGYSNNDDDTVTVETVAADGTQAQETASMLIAADGIHSAVRAQMYPDQPPIHWGGAIMWRGTSPAAPIRTGASFVGLGRARHRIVFYPISPADPETGLSEVNWIAEVTVDNSEGWKGGDWNKKVEIDDFIHHFDGWEYDWINVPEFLSKAGTVYEYPMIDRDPVPSWADGRVVLIGDAAHPMYPTGSNGASQAIVDARNLGASLIAHGLNETAFEDFDARFCEDVSQVVLRNRGAGPFGLLNLIDERCGGEFDDINDVVPEDERREFMARYKAAAGFAIETLNASPRTIAEGARVAF
ncbi:MAG: flavin-dependent oxidoreductase [Pseudomonadota bacterium]|nr:flavin-dependent oxidoreductase [Pseudomonadota bacterium]